MSILRQGPAGRQRPSRRFVDLHHILKKRNPAQFRLPLRNAATAFRSLEPLTSVNPDRRALRMLAMQ
jgi:hypothetical protein